MIKLEHVVLPSPEQMEFVIEGMRNPMNSWNKSDSKIIDDIISYETEDMYSYHAEFELGANDNYLMHKLSHAGTDHRKFMRMMPVMVRITAPLYWWKEFDTYKVGTVANSCSTMHKIQEKEFELSDFSTEHLYSDERQLMDSLIVCLNGARSLYLSSPTRIKEDWWQMIQMLPSSYNQTRNVMLNYEVLANIVLARQSHKLDEWVEFCKWVMTLPYAKELML